MVLRDLFEWNYRFRHIFVTLGNKEGGKDNKCIQTANQT